MAISREQLERGSKWFKQPGAGIGKWIKRQMNKCIRKDKSFINESEQMPEDAFMVKTNMQPIKTNRKPTRGWIN